MTDLFNSGPPPTPSPSSIARPLCESVDVSVGSVDWLSVLEIVDGEIDTSYREFDGDWKASANLIDDLDRASFSEEFEKIQADLMELRSKVTAQLIAENKERLSSIASLASTPSSLQATQESCAASAASKMDLDEE